MNNLQNKITITVGIPTYYGSPSIIETAKSILNSKDVGAFKLIITVDGNPLKPDIAEKLKNLGVIVQDNQDRRGQLGRLKQLIAQCDTQILVTTQDDVLFSPNALHEIIRAFDNDKELTMIGARVDPMPSKTFFGKIIDTTVELNYSIGTKWRNKDNYLLASGRCLAYRADFAKKYELSDVVVNSDAYIYFENKRLGGKFKAVASAVIYNKSPQNLKEHLKQSSRFQASQAEIAKHLSINLETEYKVPTVIQATSYLEIMLRKPILAICSLGLYIYTRINNSEKRKQLKRFWDTDVSTKKFN